MNNSVQQTTTKSFASAIDYAVATHIGQRRQENQDSFGIVFEKSFASFWVADGMGGASGGAQASAIAVNAVENALRCGVFNEEVVRRAINQASSDIHSISSENPALDGMGTTVSGFVISLDKVLVFNVGDSRVYRVRGDIITQLTTDHTLVGELLNTGAITQEQASGSPVSHMLTRSVGPSPDVDVDCFYLDLPPQKGDIFLVCSDGLYNTISSAEIGFILGEYRLHDALEHLVSLANMRGGKDNITGLLIECGDGFPDTNIQINKVSGQSSTGTTFVHIDLAEAAARDSFAKVKGEVDISAEILWGAQKQKKVEIIKDEDAHSDFKVDLSQGRYGQLSRIQRAIVVVSVVCLCTVGILILKQYLEDKKQQELERLEAERQRMAEFSEYLKEPRSSLLENQESAEQIAKRKELLARVLANGSEISEAEKNTLRIKRVQESIKHFDSQLERLALETDSGLLDFQKEVDARRVSIRDRKLLVAKEIERLDKSLVQWRRRLREVEELDTVNLASELATISDELKAKKELFERATWEYLKELESQGFDPNNQEIQKRVDLLIHERNVRLKDLKDSAIRFIEIKIVEEARERGLLLIESDELVEDEKLIESDHEYVQVRLSRDEGRRKELFEFLRKRRESLIQELQQLEKIPDGVVSP